MRGGGEKSRILEEIIKTISLRIIDQPNPNNNLEQYFTTDITDIKKCGTLKRVQCATPQTMKNIETINNAITIKDIIYRYINDINTNKRDSIKLKELYGDILSYQNYINKIFYDKNADLVLTSLLEITRELEAAKAQPGGRKRRSRKLEIKRRGRKSRKH